MADATEADTFDPNEAVGMPLGEATAFFERQGYTVRVTRVNGAATIATRDYRTDRINVGVKDGRVVELRGIG